ncbi:MAG: glycoside hydrolase family 3 protein [Gammaproteobacteria bacterium]|nr:glycoside hydrolase family 3 protein [Gammaproteobacteria bacterium]
MNRKILIGSIAMLASFGLAIWFYAAETKDLYQAQHAQAQEIFNKMSLDEKLGQLLFPSYVLLADSVSPNGEACEKSLVAENHTAKDDIIKACGLDQIQRYHLGAVLAGGRPYFNAPTLQNWVDLNALAVSQHDFNNSLDPVLLTGNDAIHGNMHLQGAVIFPHNIGLGVTHDAELIQQMSALVGQDSLASGFNWVFMPTVAIAHDLRWGRTYESFGQDGALVKTLSRAYINGFQNIQHGHIIGPLATAKHFIGDGATQYGFDEGDDAYEGNLSDFWRANGSGYEGALQAHVATVMVSYSAINDQGTHNNTRMHFGGQWDILNVFKNAGIHGADNALYRFSGFVVSDWNAHTRAAYVYNLSHPALDLPAVFAKSMNAGVDMFMIGEGETMGHFPESGGQYTSVGESLDAIKSAYQQGLISPKRLEDAVIRILQVKLAMNSEKAMDYSALQEKERQLALQAAQESLVLLKNNQKILPVNRDKIHNVIFVGDTNDLGVQNGGWTVTWQGQKGDQYFTGEDQSSSGAVTLELAIKQKLNAETQYYYVNNATKNTLPEKLSADNSIVIVVVAEPPYAEYMGDIGNAAAPDLWYNIGASSDTNKYMKMPQNQILDLQLSDVEAQAIATLRKQQIPAITVVYSGRPIILSNGGIKSPLENSDAVIAAFLPGTLGGKALSNAIFGDYHFRSASKGQSNTLTFSWPENMTQVENHFATGVLFPVGYGLAD